MKTLSQIIAYAVGAESCEVRGSHVFGKWDIVEKLVTKTTKQVANTDKNSIVGYKYISRRECTECGVTEHKTEDVPV